MKKERKAKPVTAWVLVTDRGRIVLGTLYHSRAGLKGAGFPSDRIARVKITEV